MAAQARITAGTGGRSVSLYLDTAAGTYLLCHRADRKFDPLKILADGFDFQGHSIGDTVPVSAGRPLPRLNWGA